MKKDRAIYKEWAILSILTLSDHGLLNEGVMGSLHLTALNGILAFERNKKYFHVTDPKYKTSAPSTAHLFTSQS
jgi:hypothetical protein